MGSASACSPESLSDLPSASLSDLCVSASSLGDLVSASSFLVVCLSSVSLGCSSPSWCVASSSLWDLSDVGLSASVLSPWRAESAASSALPLAEWSFALGSASACSAESLSDLCVSASVLSPWRAESAASLALPLAEWSFAFGSASPCSAASLSDLCVSASSLVDVESASSVLAECLSASVLSPWRAESAASSALPLAE